MKRAASRAAKLVAAAPSETNGSTAKRTKKLSTTSKDGKSSTKVKASKVKSAKVKNASEESSKPLVSLGKLFQGRVLRRPSQHNRSPYVADVKLDDGGEEVIAHAPMLDLGGLIKPGTVVRMRESKPGGKTSHSIQLVGVKDHRGNTTWIGANPNLGNMVAKELIQQGHITEALLGDSNSSITKVQSEVTMPKSPKKDESNVRSDFVVNETVVVEVKSCVCSDYPKEGAPPSDKKDRYVTVVSDEPATKYQRAGIFPIGRPGQKFEGKTVVSERCIKHLRHLSEIANQRIGNYDRAVLLMIVNRGDCEKFRPCSEACPVFAQEFQAAVSKGVHVIAAKVVWSENGDGQFGGILPIETKGKSYRI